MPEYDAVTSAVRSLRAALRESQQQFATRLGIAVRSIARYEAGNPPQGKILSQLERLANEQGLTELAAIFRSALAAEFGITSDALRRHIPQPVSIEPGEEPDFAALREILDQPERYAEELAQWKRLRSRPLKELEASGQRVDANLLMMREAGRLFAEGKSAEEVSDALRASGWSTTFEGPGVGEVLAKFEKGFGEKGGKVAGYKRIDGRPRQ